MWQTITLDLKRLNKVGEDASQVFPSGILSTTREIRIAFLDSTVPAGSTGTVNVDHFVFGLKNTASNFTLTFDSAGGSTVTPSSILLLEGSLATAPASQPVRDGFFFGGWYPGVSSTTPWIFASRTVEIDTTLFARWISSTITSSSFSANAASGLLSKINLETTVASLLNGLNEKGFVKVFKAGAEVSSASLSGTGMVLELRDSGGNLKQSLTAVVTGDINGDGKITLTDFVQLKAHLLGKGVLSNAYAKGADMNGDGSITLTDFVKTKAHLLGKEFIVPRSY
jgi:hypothetical protein